MIYTSIMILGELLPRRVILPCGSCRTEGGKHTVADNGKRGRPKKAAVSGQDKHYVLLLVLYIEVQSYQSEKHDCSATLLPLPRRCRTQQFELYSIIIIMHYSHAAPVFSYP